MNFDDLYSDYGTGSSTESSPWGSQESWTEFQSQLHQPEPIERRRSSSFAECITGIADFSLGAIMEEFKLNGLDSPYDPEEEPGLCQLSNYEVLSGMGPPTQYLRQRSWPAPDVTPSRELRRPPAARTSPEIPAAGSVEGMSQVSHEFPSQSDVIMAQKLMTALSAIPDSVLLALLHQREPHHQHHQHQLRVRKQEDMVCRFCKNNGERESYYRSHKLRVRGRVACPVLRAYTCKRCGARGDHAHTIKYCPLATDDERTKSNALMRSLRMGSARQRPAASASSYYSADYVVFGETSPTLETDGAVYRNYELDPDWEALERKLML